MSSLRLTALFAVLVGLIVLASGAIIFFLFQSGRQADYTERMAQEAMVQYRCWQATGKFCNKANELNSHHLQRMRASIYRSGKLLANLEGAPSLSLPEQALQTATGEHSYVSTPEFEVLALRMNNTDVMVMAARNNYGLERLEKLRSIIFWTSLVAVMLVAAAGYVFSRLITRPLNKFNAQMQRITATNLAERLTLVPGRDDLNTTASAFNDMIDRLQQAFEFQRSFVHHASHELRTPLASMLAHTEAALNKDLSAEQSKAVLRSLREDQRSMIDLTNSLLLLSQYEKMQSAPEDWPVLRLDELVMEVMEQFSLLESQWQVSLDFDQVPDSETAFSFRGNDQLVRSALRNLLKNAGHYSQNGQVQVRLGFGDRQCTVRFQNNGATLTEHEQMRLFIPFFRGANSVGKKGFGLGMSIVRRVALLHGGDIDYAVNEQGLNQVTMRFPTTA